MTEIGDFAFAYSAVAAFSFNRVTKLGHGAFLGCANLGEVTIPRSVREIGERAFAECPNAKLDVIWFTAGYDSAKDSGAEYSAWLW